MRMLRNLPGQSMTLERKNYTGLGSFIFLITESLHSIVKEADIIPGIYSDHSVITLSILKMDAKCGPGIWKINNSYIEHQEYCHQIEEGLTSIKKTFQHLDKRDFGKC